MHLTWRWIAAGKNAAHFGATIIGAGEIDLVIEGISSKNYVDLGTSYQFSDSITGRFNVANLLETSPAFMANAAFANNTDTGMYDIFGRSYTLSFSLQY